MSAPYNFNQPMVATALIQQQGSDGFYFPTANGHMGFAFDGAYYMNGVASISPPMQASWFTEGPGPYRGSGTPFPPYGLILLGRASLAILDESTTSLNLWMTFLFQNGLMLADNFAMGSYNFPVLSPPVDRMGFTPRGLSYANGKLTVVFSPDPGSESITSAMAVTVDFTKDSAYLDVAM